MTSLNGCANTKPNSFCQLYEDWRLNKTEIDIVQELKDHPHFTSFADKFINYNADNERQFEECLRIQQL